jgi:hypothetical protein
MRRGVSTAPVAATAQVARVHKKTSISIQTSSENLFCTLTLSGPVLGGRAASRADDGEHARVRLCSRVRAWSNVFGEGGARLNSHVEVGEGVNASWQ